MAVAPGRAADPSPARMASVVSAFVFANAAIFFAAHHVAGELLTARGLLVSIGGGFLAALLIGSLGEWLVHRYIMHRRLGPRPLRIVQGITSAAPSPPWGRGQGEGGRNAVVISWTILNLAYDLHHRAHHWIQYRPDEYVHEDRVQRVPVSSQLNRVCTTRVGRALTVGLHVAFYSFFAVVLAVLPALLCTGNPLFTGVVSAVAMIEIFLFVRVHDAVHHPGLSCLERFRWFRFLDRHHYIHHIDNRANTNFLLPLCDLLMGVLRRELSEQELALWPSYEEARRNVVRPTFDKRGMRVET